MQEVSEPTQQLLDDCFDAFTRGNVDVATAMLDDALQEKRGLMELHDTFAVGCMRASIAAMCGERALGGYLPDVSASPHFRPLLLYLEGVAAMTTGTSLQTARMKFEEAIRLDPHLILGRLGLAAVFFYAKDYKKSFSQFRIVLETLGNSAPGIVRVGLGLCTYHLGHVGTATKWLERALDVDPNDVPALLALLVVYLAQRKIKGVIDVVWRLRKVFPDNAMVLLKVTDILYFRAVSEGRVKAMAPSIVSLLSEARRAARVEDAAIADYQEGRLQVALGDLSKAQALLESSLQVLPNCLAARVHYARLLLLLGRDLEAEQLLLRINAEHPNQKEVLQMLAAYATRLGLHERALECSRLLTESVAPGDVRSWSLAAWCSRLNSEETGSFQAHVLRIYEELGMPVPLGMLVNKASMSGDTESLQKILNSELGKDFLSKTTLRAEHIPIIYNLARLLEVSDRARAYELYCHLVKQHAYFPYPYFRLYELARAEGHWRKAVMWMNLLHQVLPNEPRALVYISLLFFEQRRFAAAIDILHHVRPRSPVLALALGQIYLWGAQQRRRKSSCFLQLARDRFEYVLRRDEGNVLAAHGLACCLGFEGHPESCQLLLDRVGEIVPNCKYVRRHYEAHMANAKILSGSFKQAIDYLERDPQRAPLQSSSLAFCLLCERRYSDAIAVQKRAVEEASDEPLLQFNLALLYCASFVASIAQKREQSVEEANALRHFLAEGLNIAHRFIKTESSSRRISSAKGLLKKFCSYCLHHSDVSIPKVVANGHFAALEAQRQDAEWRRVYDAHLRSKQEAEQRMREEERQRGEEEQRIAREILDDYRLMHGNATTRASQEGEMGALKDAAEEVSEPAPRGDEDLALLLNSGGVAVAADGDAGDAGEVEK